MVYSAQNIAATLFLLTALLQACDTGAEKEALPYYNSGDFTPQFFSHTEAEKKIPHRVEGIQGIDQHDRQVRDILVKGKIHVANFFFASCGSICPTMQEHLAEVVNHFSGDQEVVFLSFSVTPEKDSVQALQQYVAHHGYTSPQWHFITGNRDSIYALARNAYFADAETGVRVGTDNVLHTEHVLLVDKNGRIRGIYNGTLETEMQQLQIDIQTLLAATPGA